MASMTSSQVKAWQTTLKNAGYDPGTIDGVWGANTQAAYNAYQLAKQNDATAGMLGGVAGYSGSGTGLPNLPAVDVSGSYSAARSQYQTALDKAYEATKADTAAQGVKLKEQYDKARGQDYVNARLGAVGNNEALAAQGLAGNMYASPTSGMSETARVAQNVALRGNLNNETLQENSARDSLAQQLIQAGYTKDVNYAQYMAQSMLDEMNTNIDVGQQKFENELSLYQLAQALASQSFNASAMGGTTGKTKTPNPPPDQYMTLDQIKKVIASAVSSNGADAAIIAVMQAYQGGSMNPSDYSAAMSYAKTLMNAANTRNKATSTKTTQTTTNKYTPSLEAK